MPDVDPCLPWIRPGWVGVELGVCQGRSSRALLERGAAHLYLVDPWEDHLEYLEGMTHKANYLETLRQVAPFAGRYTVLRMTSADAAARVPEIDFAWIDGNHRYEWVKADLEAYWPKVRPGGVLCGHDYHDTPPHVGVKSAVDEFARDRSLAVIDVYPCWVIEKHA